MSVLQQAVGKVVAAYLRGVKLLPMSSILVPTDDYSKALAGGGAAAGAVITIGMLTDLTNAYAETIDPCEPKAVIVAGVPAVPFKQRSQAECTRDVIFLLRSRRWVYEDYDPVTEEGTGERREEWNVESVFLSREEGETFAKATAHRYPEGWQVYGVCAEGQLAKIVQQT